MTDNGNGDKNDFPTDSGKDRPTGRDEAARDESSPKTRPRGSEDGSKIGCAGAAPRPRAEFGAARSKRSGRLLADGGRPLADFRPSDLDRVAVTDDIASVTVDVIAEGREREYSGLAIADATDTVTDDGEYVATEIVFDSAGLRDDEHKDLLRGLSTATVARPGEASDLSGTVVHAVTGDNVLLVVSFPGFVATDEPAGGGDDGV